MMGFLGGLVELTAPSGTTQFPLVSVHQVAFFIDHPAAPEIHDPLPISQLGPLCYLPPPPSCPHLQYLGQQPFHRAITSPDRVTLWPCAVYKDHVHSCSVTR